MTRTDDGVFAATYDEAAAAVAGLASLAVGPLSAALVGVNAQLRGYVPCVLHTFSFYSYAG